jgi:hypothetical protein
VSKRMQPTISDLRMSPLERRAFAKWTVSKSPFLRLSSTLAILAGELGARGGEANDAVDWQRFRQETPPCRICPPASPRSL